MADRVERGLRGVETTSLLHRVGVLTLVAATVALNAITGKEVQADEPPAAAAAAHNGAAKQDLLLGLRRIGVLAGRAIECSAEVDRPHEIEGVMNIGNKLAASYGLSAAFNLIGAAGYGAGKPFDEKECQSNIAQWDAFRQKFGEN